MLHLQALGKLDALAPYLSDERVRLATPQSDMVQALLKQSVSLHYAALRNMEEQRMAQGGPRVMNLVSDEPSAVDPAAQQALQALAERQASERIARYKLTHSFGEGSSGERCAAEALFVEKFGGEDGERAEIKDLKNVCLEFGYWLGQDLDHARLSLNADGSGLFSFRDLVSWWSQSSRSWLFLLDNEAFTKRHEYVTAVLSRVAEYREKMTRLRQRGASGDGRR